MKVFDKDFDIELKELGRKETKKLAQRHKELEEIFKDIQKKLKQTKRLNTHLQLTNEELAATDDKLPVLERKKDILLKIEALEDEIETLDVEKMEELTESSFKDKLKLCVYGDDAEEFLKLADEMGYKASWEALVKAQAKHEKK